MQSPSHERISTLLSARKSATNLSLWLAKPNERFIELRTSLAINGIIEGGVDFFMQCKTDQPDEKVTVGINIETKNKPRCCARIDWRSTAHPNSHTLCGEMKWQEAGETHFHDPRLHDHTIDVMEFLQNNLPIATAIVPEPKDFMELMQTCATLLNITNLTTAKTPPWQPRTTLF